mmetsp:Transcript_81628/g.141892  ORF Transcript_81628/g.141892 Transcript_81628/m.141892 type:complete len:358 (+) Transcript_81628:50-1123(+)
MGSKSCLLVLSAVVVAVAFLVGIGGLEDKLCHLRTVAQALKTLNAMDQSDFDAFFNSYDVFDAPQNNASDEVKVNSVYKVLVPLMGLGSLTKFYIPPVVDASKNSFKYLNHNQVLFEQKMADILSLRPGKVALDIGCGQGLIADTVQEHTGAKIIGINISPEQLETARSNAKSKGKLGKVLEFDKVSMNDDPLPYPDNTFDAVYIMQAVTYVHNPKRLMKEVRRILKPGGMFSDLSIVTLDKYNPDNQTQYRMLQNAKRVSVVPTFRPRQVYEDACTSNGFSLNFSKNLGHADMGQAAKDYFSPFGDVMKYLNSLGLISTRLMASMDRMNQYGEDFIQGDREELFTINYWIVCQAPL